MRRKSYTAYFKLDVINHAKTFGTRAAALKFEVRECIIRKWKQQEERLTACNRYKRAFRRVEPKWLELEEILKNWVIDKRNQNRGVTTMMIRQEAVQVARNLGLEGFSAGLHWCQNFMKRSGFVIRRRTSVGQPLPDDSKEKIRMFREFVMTELTEISPESLGNADEVPVPFDIVMNQTVESKGKDHVFISSTGHEKSNFIVMLSVLATGEKLKPLIVFKRKTVPKESFPEGIVVKANPKGWMTAPLMKEWLLECSNERPNRDMNPTKSMLILDSARCHITDVIKEEIQKSSKLAVIPGGLTKFLQPLDLSVNKPFKENLRKCWEVWMSDPENAQYTNNGRKKRASCTIVAEWVKSSFEAISTSTIINWFHKALTEE